jgi:hypothetical protein
LVTWEDATTLPVSFSDRIRLGRIFAPLGDPIKFADVRVREGGRILEWPEPADDDGEPLIDVDADALFDMDVEQRKEGWFHRLMTHFVRVSAPEATVQSPPPKHAAGF